MLFLLLLKKCSSSIFAFLTIIRKIAQIASPSPTRIEERHKRIDVPDNVNISHGDVIRQGIRRQRHIRSASPTAQNANTAKVHHWNQFLENVTKKSNYEKKMRKSRNEKKRKKKKKKCFSFLLYQTAFVHSFVFHRLIGVDQRECVLLVITYHPFPLFEYFKDI